MEGLDRLKLLVNNDIKKITDKKILILGLGGVGGYALESIVRSGVKKVIIVDADKFDITNLNRQLMATQKTIGLNKTDVYEKRIKEINPNCEVVKITEFIDEKNIDILFNEKFDYAIDACDTLITKYYLIKKCLEKDIKFISIMGTGNKLDPSKLEITDLKKTTYDPLARKLRYFFKNEKRRIPVICSTEQPIKNKENIIGSTSFVPPTAGLLATSYIINDILKGD